MTRFNFISVMVSFLLIGMIFAPSCGSGGGSSGCSSDDDDAGSPDDTIDETDDSAGSDDTAENCDGYEVVAEIPASSAEWIDTGFDVDEGDVLIVKACGAVDLGAGGANVPPEGLDQVCGEGCPNDAGHVGALTAKVISGKADGCVFEAGASYQGLTACVGNLYLVVNDSDYSDNSGVFRVAVEIDHPVDDADDDSDDDLDDDLDDDSDDDADDDADDDTQPTTTTSVPTTTTSTTTSTASTEPAEMTVKLWWGIAPADLDLHTWAPCPFAAGGDCAAMGGYQFGIFHLYYVNRGVHAFLSYFDLVLDDVTSYGPEIVEIFDASPTLGEVYRFVVHDYTNRSSSTSAAMSNSANLRVEAIIGDRTETFTMPTNTPATVWRVFEASYDGAHWTLTPLDEYAFQSDPSLVY